MVVVETEYRGFSVAIRPKRLGSGAVREYEAMCPELELTVAGPDRVEALERLMRAVDRRLRGGSGVAEAS